MHRAAALLLSGRIVLADGDARQRFVLIRDGVIRWISRSRPPEGLLAGAREILAGPQDWVFPGLIDLHSHTGFNFLPLWSSARAPFDNRHVWRSDPGYRDEIAEVRKGLGGSAAVKKVFSELQAVAGGTTLLDEPYPLESEHGEGSTLLCRCTGRAADLGLPSERSIPSVVDFFRPNREGRPEIARGWDGDPAPLDAYRQNRDRHQAHLVHLAEGRSGFGSHRGVDPYSRAEFEAFMAHEALADTEAVRKSHLVLVHGCGIDTENPEHLDFLADREISIVWSPASNLLLYDDTLDIEALVRRGLTVALGSDWSPSGTKHVWDEAKFARFFLNAIGSTLSDAEVFRMVTTNPARCLGLERFGRIEVGSPADFFVLRSPLESDNALEVFFSTTDRDVLATVVAGLPIYGDEAFLAQFGLELQPLPDREGSAVRNKVVHLPTSAGVADLTAGVNHLEDELKRLNPPVFRSNLLVESDVPYRRRFHFLRARAERYGWRVRQRRRKGPSATPGLLPSPPDAVQLRMGRVDPARRQSLLKLLGLTVLPATVNLGWHRGLSAYLCATAPSEGRPTVPDEVSLLAWESRRLHHDGRNTVAARLQDLMEQGAFSAGYEMRFAQVFAGQARPGEAYQLLDSRVDWHLGEVRLGFAYRLLGVNESTFLAAAAQSLGELQASPPGYDGLVAAVGDGWICLWGHVAEGELPEPSPLGRMETVAEVEEPRIPRTADAKASLGMEWAGVDLRWGDFLRLDFERRGLLPW